MTTSIDYTMPPATCPECGLLHDLATNPVGGKQPMPGDFTVCIRCIAVLRYTDGLQLRSLCSADRAHIPAGLERVVAAIRLAQQRRPDLSWGRNK